MTYHALMDDDRRTRTNRIMLFERLPRIIVLIMIYTGKVITKDLKLTRVYNNISTECV